MIVLADLHGRLPDVWRPCDAIVLAGDICPDRGGAIGQAEYLDRTLRPSCSRTLFILGSIG